MVCGSGSEVTSSLDTDDIGCIGSVTSAYGCGSRCTRRRAQLRRNARHKVVCRALSLMVTAVEAARNLDSPFGKCLKSLGITDNATRHASDLLPLPCVDASSWTVPVSTLPSTQRSLLILVNASAAGLNHLHGGSRRNPGLGAPSKCQRSALEGICFRWWQLGIHMAVRADHLHFDPSAYHDLVGRKSSSWAMPLVAASVDVLDVCAAVDAQQHLPPHLREIVESPSERLIVATGKLCGDVVFSGGYRSEYVRLRRREFRARKVTFRNNCTHVEQLFFLPKKASGALREVWNGKGLSESTADSPMPPWLASPSCLAALEA